MGDSLMQLRRGILLNTPHLETASGEIATFQTDMKAPLKRLLASLAPIQDLHGYSNPWPAGGGKNKFDEPNATVYNRFFNTNNNWQNSSTGACSYAIPAVAGETWAISASNPSLTIFRVGYLTDALPTANNQSPQIYGVTRKTGPGNVILEIPNDATYVLVQINNDYARNGLVQIEVGASTATDYAPYSNICPITGLTNVRIRRMGRNLAYRSSTSTANIYNGGDLIPVKTGEKIYVYAEYTYTSSASMWSAVYASARVTGKNNYIAQYSSFSSGQVKTYTITKDGYFGVAYNAGVATYTVSKMMISKTPIISASDYVPCDAVILNFSWETEAGTVYGGTLDVKAGTLTVTWAVATITSLLWTYSSNGYFISTSNSDVNKTKKPGRRNVISSAYMTSTASSAAASPNFSVIGSVTLSQICVKDSRYTVVADWKADMGNEVICWELAEPVVYDLSPQTVRSLIGTDNIWADAGEVEAEYWTHI